MNHKTFRNYIEVLKPRVSILLTFIGICASIIAAEIWRMFKGIDEQSERIPVDKDLS